MENVGTRVVAEPWRMIALAALAFGTVLVVLALTALVFARAGASRAFVLGLVASQRNMGLMLAATARDLPDLVALFRLLPVPDLSAAAAAEAAGAPSDASGIRGSGHTRRRYRLNGEDLIRIDDTACAPRTAGGLLD